MHTIMSTADILVQYLLFGEVLHRVPIIIYLSVRLTFLLCHILNEHAVTLY